MLADKMGFEEKFGEDLLCYGSAGVYVVYTCGAWS